MIKEEIQELIDRNIITLLSKGAKTSDDRIAVTEDRFDNKKVELQLDQEEFIMRRNRQYLKVEVPERERNRPSIMI